MPGWGVERLTVFMIYDVNISDEELVRRALENPDDFFYLMKRYEGRLLRYIRRISAVSYEEAEDILQEAFLKVYRNLNAFDQKLKFSNWIYRIVHNTVINHQRKKKVRAAVWVRLDEKDRQGAARHLDGVAPESGRGDSRFQDEEMRESLDRALLELPEKYREVLVLRYLEDKSYEEISEILKKPGGTVASLIKRAKKRLRKIAPRHGLEDWVNEERYQSRSA